LGFVALNPTYILPVLLRNAKPNNGRFPNQTPKVSILIRLAVFLARSRALMKNEFQKIPFLSVLIRLKKGVGYRIRRVYTLKEIREISTILYQNHCIWSLLSGNALGIYREGRILRKNEDDVDIGVIAETWGTKIERKIREQGYNLEYFCGGYYKGSEGVHITLRRRGLIFDIYPVFKGIWEGKAYRWYGGTNFHRCFFEPRLLERTRTVTVDRINLEIPENTDAYLRAEYGADYMIPNDNWDWEKDPKCQLHLKETYLSQADVYDYLSR
jgi:hypothetical protein